MISKTLNEVIKSSLMVGPINGIPERMEKNLQKFFDKKVEDFCEQKLINGYHKQLLKEFVKGINQVPR